MWNYVQGGGERILEGKEREEFERSLCPMRKFSFETA